MSRERTHVQIGLLRQDRNLMMDVSLPSPTAKEMGQKENWLMINLSLFPRTSDSTSAPAVSLGITHDIRVQLIDAHGHEITGDATCIWGKIGCGQLQYQPSSIC